MEQASAVIYIHQWAFTCWDWGKERGSTALEVAEERENLVQIEVLFCFQPNPTTPALQNQLYPATTHYLPIFL